MMIANVSTVRNEQADNPVNSVPNQTPADGVVYEVMAAEDVAQVVTSFTSDEQYSKLQRDTSTFTQSTTVPNNGDGHDDVEAYYGKLDKTEQYIVSSSLCECLYVSWLYLVKAVL